ncbi:hypothetical protein [Cellulomonas soli]|uniref:Leucine rich repeat variant n=1 Tax=Cellulomonas soli TaxID=931535 RepID=A0A512PHL3_9CELL|nr:hypothetical protein [Cellulomonas soli]NYI59173.1 hypothetical protein [Cellulomonas soli]GEP70677.1 hypothetical protein CSO01_33920 [Cellulomonas soli]
MPRRPLPPRRTAWQIAQDGDPAELLATALDPSSDAEMIAAIAPGYQDRDADPILIRAVLAHPNVSAGVVSRFATSPAPDIRARVAAHPLAPGPALQALALDPDATIAATAQHRLDHPDTPPPAPPLRRSGRR